MMFCRRNPSAIDKPGPVIPCWPPATTFPISCRVLNIPCLVGRCPARSQSPKVDWLPASDQLLGSYMLALYSDMSCGAKSWAPRIMKGDRAWSSPVPGDTCSARNLLNTSAGKFSWVCICPKMSMLAGPPTSAPDTPPVNGLAVGSGKTALAPRLGRPVPVPPVMSTSSW